MLLTPDYQAKKVTEFKWWFSYSSILLHSLVSEWMFPHFSPVSTFAFHRWAQLCHAAARSGHHCLYIHNAFKSALIAWIMVGFHLSRKPAPCWLHVIGTQWSPLVVVPSRTPADPIKHTSPCINSPLTSFSSHAKCEGWGVKWIQSPALTEAINTCMCGSTAVRSCMPFVQNGVAVLLT